jgi:hypothetical protein
VEEKEETKTPSPLAFENGEDSKNMNEKSYGSCSQITIES